MFIYSSEKCDRLSIEVSLYLLCIFKPFFQTADTLGRVLPKACIHLTLVPSTPLSPFSYHFRFAVDFACGTGQEHNISSINTIRIYIFYILIIVALVGKQFNTEMR